MNSLIVEGRHRRLGGSADGWSDARTPFWAQEAAALLQYFVAGLLAVACVVDGDTEVLEGSVMSAPPANMSFEPTFEIQASGGLMPCVSIPVRTDSSQPCSDLERVAGTRAATSATPPGQQPTYSLSAPTCRRNRDLEVDRPIGFESMSDREGKG